MSTYFEEPQFPEDQFYLPIGQQQSQQAKVECIHMENENFQQVNDEISTGETYNSAQQDQINIISEQSDNNDDNILFEMRDSSQRSFQQMQNIYFENSSGLNFPESANNEIYQVYEPIVKKQKLVDVSNIVIAKCNQKEVVVKQFYKTKRAKKNTDLEEEQKMMDRHELKILNIQSEEKVLFDKIKSKNLKKLIQNEVLENSIRYLKSCKNSQVQLRWVQKIRLDYKQSKTNQKKINQNTVRAIFKNYKDISDPLLKICNEYIDERDRVINDDEILKMCNKNTSVLRKLMNKYLYSEYPKYIYGVTDKSSNKTEQRQFYNMYGLILKVHQLLDTETMTSVK